MIDEDVDDFANEEQTYERREKIPEGVEVSMYTTAPQPRPIGKPTTDKQQLLKAIGLIAPDSGAGAFFDALFEAANRGTLETNCPQ